MEGGIRRGREPKVSGNAGTKRQPVEGKMEAGAGRGRESKVNGPGGDIEWGDKRRPADKTLRTGGLAHQQKFGHPKVTSRGMSTSSLANNGRSFFGNADGPDILLGQETAENVGIDGPYYDSINGPDIANDDVTGENVNFDGSYCDVPNFGIY
ncbi:hypothetical protein V5799_029513 [Amblyomma americanum]|uniref:Uncharacterized protein n=1 Tax=Amblyomma americanum TaxID=6943 RepID=A0AAQ4ERJ4_AMBAM